MIMKYFVFFVLFVFFVFGVFVYFCVDMIMFENGVVIVDVFVDISFNFVNDICLIWVEMIYVDYLLV